MAHSVETLFSPEEISSRLSFNSLCRLHNADADEIVDSDTAYRSVIVNMTTDKTKIWNAVELEELHHSYGGTHLSRRLLLEKLSNDLKRELLIQ